MSRIPPNHVSDVPVSLEVRNQLLSASCSTGFKKEAWEIAAEAIGEWTRRHNPDAIAVPATKGYQWKSLFLPDGTLLRTVFGGKNYHCIVEADAIVYNGQPVSPSGFANAVGGIRRNAWRCTWILLPQTDQWKLADTLRTDVPQPRGPARPAQQDRPMRDRATPAAVTAPDPVAAQKKPLTASLSGHYLPRMDSNEGEPSARQPRGSSVSPPQCTRRGERRAIASEQARPAPQGELLTDLLPLLHRICAIDEVSRGTRPIPVQ